MSRPVVCDQCGKHNSDRAGFVAYNIHVQSDGAGPYRSILDHDFCTIACLAAWANHMLDDKNQGMHLT